MIEPVFYPHIFDQQLYQIKDKNQPESEIAKPVIQGSIIEKEIDKSVRELDEKCSKNIWILIQPENNESLSAIEFDIISKTLTALMLKMDDIAIFVAAEVRHTLFEKVNLAGKKIVDFGVSPATMLSEKKPLNEIVILREGNYLFTATLQQLQNNLELKKIWWKKMKVMFE